MRWDRVLSVVHAHAEGEVGRVITGGVVEVPGATMLEKKQHLERNGDELRRLCIFEPRGGPTMSVNLVLPPTDPAAAAGMIVMEAAEYPPMSGSNAICVVTTLLETGMVAMQEPETIVVLDTPAGLVTATAICRDGKCERVSLESVPAFVDRLDARLEVAGMPTVTCDIAYGGAFFALVDASALGFALRPDEARDLVLLGQKVTLAAAEQLAVKHPETPAINTVSFTHFGTAPDDQGVRKSAVVMQPGRLDRSPCGTGTMAKLAALDARGELADGAPLVHESPIGTRFTAEIVARTRVGDKTAVVPRLSGRGWVTASMQIGVDPSDPFPAGFVMPDVWGPDAAALMAGPKLSAD
ncbi:MAG: proline racemase family protein [Alphaproteobacteria bacterium]|nr:proline racemase family protein [Alphaproteobacteria bacterium]